VMLPKTLKYGLVLVSGVLALASLSAAADDKKEEKSGLSGTWAKKDDELKLEFADKDVLKIVPHGDSAVIVIVCDYRVEKEGLVKAKITGFEGKEEVKKQIGEKLPVGFKFRFKWTVKGDAATLNELTGENVEMLKSHLEGDFKQKK